MLKRIIIGGLLIFFSSAVAQDHGHGPAEKLGVVHFSTSCNQAAQREFDRAVALLHSFEFKRAIAGFNATLKDDPACGIAYWGIALSQWSNPFASGLKDNSQLQSGRASAQLGLKSGAKTERERAYIAAVSALYTNFDSTPQHSRLIAYRDAMEALASKYSSDHEAQIFYALSIAESEDLSDKTYAGRLKAGAILEKLFDEEPNHPGLAHYIIHTYDVPPLAGRALKAARRYSEIAPAAPHALHMPSHTFTRTGYWQDSIRSNVAAAEAAKREGETAEELHTSDYLVYAYLQTGQDEAARQVVSALPEIASRFDPNQVIGGAGGPSAGYFALAAIPARNALEREDWAGAAQLTARESAFPYTEAVTWFARGLGSARVGKTKAAYDAAASLKEIRERLANSGEKYWAVQVEIQEREVRAWAMLAENKKKEEALREMRLAAEMEDGTEKSAVTPGPLAAARELLGEMLLQTDQPALALEQFEAALKKEPNRFRTLYGAAHSARLAGRSDVSSRYFRELLNTCERADRPGRAELSEAIQAVSREPVSRSDVQQPASLTPDQGNIAGWDQAWTNLLNDVQQTFTPSRGKLIAVEVDLVVGNPGVQEDELTLTIIDAAGNALASVTRTVPVAAADRVMFTMPADGVLLAPGETYRIRLAGGPTFGWKYVVGGYDKGEAIFNGKPLLPGARSTFLFRTFGAE